VATVVKTYRGRFAPSPTGPLHLGSLFAAVISYMEARKHDGQWLLRIEDIDPLREQKNSKQSILDTLIAHSLIWDETPCIQSERSALYDHALSSLAKLNLCYCCPCSRTEMNNNDGLHSENCLLQRRINKPYAVKFRAGNSALLDNTFKWHDAIQGWQKMTLDDDFVLKRKEGFYAYQLAVVCDDIDQDISHVVRGCDLLSSTPMQLALYQAFDKAPPIFSHFPVLISQEGQKLSKQNLSQPIDDSKALSNLLTIFGLLNLKLPRQPKSTNEALSLALPVWDISIISAQSELLSSVN